MSSNGDTYESPPDGFTVAPVTYECPACGQAIRATPGPVARLLQCPACGDHVVIAATDGSTDLLDDAGGEAEKDASELSELDSLRMRHLVVTRRTAMRSRTYNILGAAACLTGAVKLTIMTVSEVRSGAGWRLRAISFALFAIVALSPIPFLMRRAAHWARESRGVKMPDPETPPDFTPLSDGSQHAKNLEDLH